MLQSRDGQGLAYSLSACIFLHSEFLRFQLYQLHFSCTGRFTLDFQEPALWGWFLVYRVPHNYLNSGIGFQPTSEAVLRTNALEKLS
jgi:hypothetical protein